MSLNSFHLPNYQRAQLNLHCRDLQHRSLPFNIHSIQSALRNTGIGRMGCITRSNVNLSEKERNLETDSI